MVEIKIDLKNHYEPYNSIHNPNPDRKKILGMILENFSVIIWGNSRNKSGYFLATMLGFFSEISSEVSRNEYGKYLGTKPENSS